MDITQLDKTTHNINPPSKNIIFNYVGETRVIWTLTKDNKVDVEVIGDLTENAKLMIATIKELLKGEPK